MRAFTDSELAVPGGVQAEAWKTVGRVKSNPPLGIGLGGFQGPRWFRKSVISDIYPFLNSLNYFSNSYS